MTTQPLQKTGSVVTDRASGEVVLVFDSNLEEKYQRDADVTAYPVEKQVDKTENHQAKQRVFELVGLISNTPLAQEQNVGQRAPFYFQVIDALIEAGTRLNITTGLTPYDDVVIKSYTVVRDFQRGQVLEVSLKLVQIQTVESATVQVPEDILAAALKASGKSKRKKNDGPKPETDPQKRKRRRSILDGWFYD